MLLKNKESKQSKQKIQKEIPYNNNLWVPQTSLLLNSETSYLAGQACVLTYVKTQTINQAMAVLPESTTTFHGWV